MNLWGPFPKDTISHVEPVAAKSCSLLIMSKPGLSSFDSPVSLSWLLGLRGLDCQRVPSPGSLLTAITSHVAGLPGHASAVQMGPAPAVTEECAEGSRGSCGAQLGGHISLGKCLLTPAG